MMIEELISWLEAFLAFLPGVSGRLVRRYYFKFRVNKAGSKISIGRHIEIAGPQNISFGNQIYIVDGAVLRAVKGKINIGDKFALNGNARIIADCGGRIMIGNSVMIGPNAVIRASNHCHNDVTKDIWDQGQTGGQIIIGNDVWIGANVTIVSNVKIGSHSIVAAGSVVTKNFPDFSVIAGVPAKLIRRRVAK
jgi:galactoside O-acetyltransferase